MAALELHLIIFLFQGNSVVCDGRDDAAEFADIRSAMKVLMMTDQEIWDILKILAALLHMGNVKYKGKVIDNLDATDIPDKSNVERVAAILGVDTRSLIDALTSRTIFAHGESVVSTLNMGQSRLKKSRSSGVNHSVAIEQRNYKANTVESIKLTKANTVVPTGTDRPTFTQQ